jgi:hypothetical protein
VTLIPVLAAHFYRSSSKLQKIQKKKINLPTIPRMELQNLEPGSKAARSNPEAALEATEQLEEDGEEEELFQAIMLNQKLKKKQWV